MILITWEVQIGAWSALDAARLHVTRLLLHLARRRSDGRHSSSRIVRPETLVRLGRDDGVVVVVKLLRTRKAAEHLCLLPHVLLLSPWFVRVELARRNVAALALLLGRVDFGLQVQIAAEVDVVVHAQSEQMVLASVVLDHLSWFVD